MNELTKAAQVVRKVLIEDEHARNSDDYLYLQVLQIMAEPKGIDINHMPVPTFLTICRSAGLPAFEHVRRTRQKAQEKYPELRATDEVVRKRREREKMYRDFARGVEQ